MPLFDRDPTFPASARTAAMNAQAGDLEIKPLPKQPKPGVGGLADANAPAKDPAPTPSSGAAAGFGLLLLVGGLLWWKS